MHAIAVLGPVCTVLSVSLVWPQVIKVYRAGTVAGLSSNGTLHGLAACTLWTMYGAARGVGPLIVSNGALILGCWVLAPIPLYIGYVGFGMGLVLLLCFVFSGIISPILWAWFGERTVIGKADRAESAVGAVEIPRRVAHH